MNRLLLAGAMALAFTTSAYAGQPGNQGHGHGGCGVGQHTNGCGQKPPPTNHNPHLPIGGLSQGQGQTQTQGQHQGQSQGQSTNVTNSGNNVGNSSATGGAGGQGGAGGNAASNSSSTASATGGNSSATGGNATVGNVSTGASTSGATASADNSGSGNSAVTITEEAQKRNPVNTAYAAPLSIGGGVCAYAPASGGISLVPFSGSLTGARIDKGCERRANADVLARIGYTQLACELLLNNREVADTARRIGFVCAPDVVAPSFAPPPPAPPIPPAPPLPPKPPEYRGERG